MIQMFFCMTWQEHRPHLFGKLCTANTASYHPSSTRLMGTRGLNKVVSVSSCPSGPHFFAQIILMPRLVLLHWNSANKDDPWVGTLCTEPNYLVYLRHLYVTLQWKLLLLIKFRSLQQFCIHPVMLKTVADREAWNIWELCNYGKTG